MKLKISLITVVFILSTMSAFATSYTGPRNPRIARERSEISGMLSVLSKRVEGKVSAGKVREKFFSMSREKRALILALYRQMERTESVPGREIAVSLIMALIVLS